MELCVGCRSGSSECDASECNSWIPPGYNQTNGPYFKFGIYRHPTDNTAIVE
jgi:hypothetical protein